MHEQRKIDAIDRSITVLPVRDIAEGTGWYERALGLETMYLHDGDDDSEPVNYAVLRRGDFYVHLILDEPEHDAPAWTHAGNGYLYLLVCDVNAAFAEVQASGTPITRAIETEIWGARAFNLTDPSGNAIHIEQLM